MPTAYLMTDLVREYLRVRGKRKPFISISMPGKAARAIRDGANLSPDHAVGHRTWEEFLAERVTS